MDKQEFLEKLAEALREYMDDSSAYEHISYYSNYIDKEIKSGKSEKDVINALGNPRLIAKSIIDRGGYKASESSYASYDTRVYDDTGRMEDDASYDHFEGNAEFFVNGKKINPIFAKFVTILIVIAVVAVLFLVLWGISWLVIKVVLPVVLVALVVGFIVTLVQQRK
jgi:hypothetical protein